jgi:hypothetical protein
VSFVTCPCGFRADGFAGETLAAYRAHECDFHDAELVVEESPRPVNGWYIVEVFVFCILVGFVCWLCAGLVTR